MTRMLIHTVVVLAAVSAVPTAARLAGQEKDAKPAAPAAKPAEMAEDVEVLRHLLNRACGLPRYQVQSGFGGGGIGGAGFGAGAQPHYGIGGGIGGNPGFQGGGGFGGNGGFGGQGGFGGFGGHLVQVDTFDGVYLPGHGAVFTLKVPAPNRAGVSPPAASAGTAETCYACHATGSVKVASGESKPKPVHTPADWDRVRNDLRGAKPLPVTPAAPAGKPGEVCDPGSVTEAVMRTLAANGRRLRHLQPAEAVTVVVSYEGFPTRAAKPAADAAEVGFSPDEAKQIAIADLHLKQGNPADAAAAYRQALARIGFGPVKVPDARFAQLKARPGAVDELKAAVSEVRRKHAHALIAAGDLKAAKEALDAALNTTVEAAGAGTVKAVPVPAKLVISATKAHLDAADTLDPTAFRKGLKVESAGLPAADAGKK